MLTDFLIALVVVVVAAALGVVVHPVLWLVIVLTVLWLYSRRSSWSHPARY